MVDDWIDRLLGDGFEIYLPSLMIAKGDDVRFEGSGQLLCRPGLAISVSAETGGADVLLAEAFRSPSPLGKLLPSREYVSVQSRTDDGWDLFTTRTPCQGLSMKEGSSQVLWNFEAPGLSLRRRRTSQARNRTIRGLMGPTPTRWPRGTTTQTEEGRFKSFKRDYLLARTRFGQVTARQRSDRWFEVEISIDQNFNNFAGSELICTVCDAFSFLLGA